MTTLVIGGDHIDKIRHELAAHGLDKVEHWVGRKPADARREIPARVNLVVMVTDQLSHPMLYNATIKATRLGLPIIYSRRSAYELREKLAERFGARISKPAFRQFSTGWASPFNTLSISY